MAFRFGKKQRLKHSSEFRRVRIEGESKVGRWMILGVLIDSNQPRTAASVPLPLPAPEGAPPQETHGGKSSPRLGIITSRKIGGAVLRNQFRRRIRHIHQTYVPRIPGTPWLVVIARHCAAQASFAQLEAEWCKLARKAGILPP